MKDFTGLLLLKGSARRQDLARFPKIEAGDDDFLNGEASHLDLLVDLVDLKPSSSRRNIGICLHYCFSEHVIREAIGEMSAQKDSPPGLRS